MTGEVVLALNAGSSSIKFALYGLGGIEENVALARGTLSGGADGLTLRLDGTKAAERVDVAADASLAARMTWLFARIERLCGDASLVAVSHRIVHGGLAFDAPVVVDAAVRRTIEDLVPLAPLHQPANLQGIDLATARWPHARQIACFDTAFHRRQPRLAQLYALPRALTDAGIVRYGFHGLSYESVAARLPALLGTRADGRVIVAHLGSGASLCAMHARRSVECTMGFSPLEGVPMGTRSGDVDPGVVLHLLRERALDVDAVEDVLTRQSGFLGVSGISADLRVLEASGSPHAEEAMALFAYRVASAIGSLAAALQGLDALVFTGGIGEHSAAMRARILARCEWLGVRVDARANAAHAERLDGEGSAIAVRRAVADEEIVLARAAAALAT